MSTLFFSALFVFVLWAALSPALHPLQVARIKRPAKEAERKPFSLFREQTTGQVDITAFNRTDVKAPVVSDSFDGRGIVKRVFDIAAASSLLLLMAPLLIVTAIAIKIESNGPVLYLQRRIGLNGRPFKIVKFRSMVVDAEKDGARWAATDDDRVTRVGRIIRKLRIDEIPQALNVLRGEMSFIGPRPERPEFVELLEKEIPNYHLRHVVKPGITGWAQVKYVYGASVEDAREKLKYDLFYIKHFSIARDILIVFMTVRVALFGIGSR